ncbi:aspartate 1-decarboxylase [Agaricicola taiwanensis]|uniref:Aspartate 1-decarboxylase n=1 Tax=Agaricicola taiwanensis TaxID=591372 RepID=A0A8J2VUM2_9RHOB|nr:aspartate 1-decarboxylase [Agaricicola taiwanensis]GGE40969.1 aspartate 1-decarboxylase [Agaricicola taiwanensis]
MLVTLMKGKIHRARVTGADLDYEGSISIDRRLIAAAGFFLNERVDIYNITTGARFSTYVIPAMVEGAPQAEICLNGAAARLVQKGDEIIIAAYAQMTPEEADIFRPKVVLVDENNQPKGT